jgi:perosamine synthetase
VKPRVFYTKPSITELEVCYATDAAANGWGERCYEYIARFENSFKAHLGVKHAIATSSCTGALHMGMAALGISPGDEVIMADTNWIATAAPIVHLGATPVFVDIVPESWCIDPELAEAAITPRTKAIVAVHLYGNLCEMDRLLALGEKHGIPVIEDAAEAIGSITTGIAPAPWGASGLSRFTAPRRSPLVKAACSSQMTTTYTRKCLLLATTAAHAVRPSSSGQISWASNTKCRISRQPSVAHRWSVSIN